MATKLIKPRINRPLGSVKFITYSALFVILLFFSYTSIIHTMISHGSENIPTSFKELLLTKTRGQKIIIDSGSNSQYAIDPLILERTFNMPVINLSDSIYHPLAHKYRYLTKYTNPGDIIILPLEWVNYYHKPKFSAYANKMLSRQLRYYYQSLPYNEKFEFMTQYTGISALFRALPERLTQAIDSDFHKNKLLSYKKRLELNNGNSLGSLLQPKTGLSASQFVYNSPCNEEYFGAFKIGEQFTLDLKLLHQARNNGVTIAFTWPAYVDKKDDGCFQSEIFREKIEKYTQEITQLLQTHGFKVIGIPQDSIFGEKHIFDMFYHILQPAATARTERLAERMIEAGITPAATSYRAGDSIKQLMNEVNRLLRLQMQDNN